MALFVESSQLTRTKELELRVQKRSGTSQQVSFDKILNRLRNLGAEANLYHINYTTLAIKVIEQLYDNISTTQIDELSAEQCISLSSLHTNYGELASRIVISNHEKNTSDSFMDIVEQLYQYINVKNGNKHSPMVNDHLYTFVKRNKYELQSMIDFSRDYLINYFGFKTLERAYLFRCNNVILERPQHMWLRVAIGIHGCKSTFSTDLENKNSLKLVKETYDLMSTKHFTHATPTLFNAGTNFQQMSSCYLMAMKEDSLEGIYDTLKDCSSISRHAGGIGMHISNIRGKGSFIHGTNGVSNGIVPMLQVFNNTARYVDQGGGRRPGSFAIYLEPWHPDIVSFLDLKKTHGDESTKARDLFYALWISDLFMTRVKNTQKWSLMCPNECPGLNEVYGDEFKELYEKYEAEGKFVAQIGARDLWFKILDAQMETGTPYMLYKDAVNKKTNQKNVGTIKSSNLCCEIMEYSDKDETAVCNLASIGLPTFVDPIEKTFDYEKLHQVVKVITNNLNEIIDINFYPTPSTRLSNMRHRPIGVGVQGLADTFLLMDLAFDSKEAEKVNVLIFETIYHASLQKSNEISKLRYEQMKHTSNRCNISEDEREVALSNPGDTRIGAYSRFIGSPASQGILQYDMWNIEPTPGRYDWMGLKQSIIQYGIRNALSVAPMPTASTSQILGFNECFEPITGNIYARRTSAGEFTIVNKYLLDELSQLNLWTPALKNSIIEHGGSVQHLTQLSDHIRNKYKTVWEISMKTVINMSAARGAFVCQSQSLNIWVAKPSYKDLTNIHFYGWNKGLKTGMYYLRRKADHQAQQFTIEPTQENPSKQNENEEDSHCDMCSA
jgi:ribonucleotide reductase alpha subunit